MSIQITFTDDKNSLTSHIPNIKLQEKFLKFLETETETETETNYLVEFFETNNLEKLYECKFATEIKLFFKCNNYEKTIDLRDFKKLRKMYIFDYKLRKNILFAPNIKEIVYGSNFNSE
jgi:hypothetical protein